MCKNYIIHDFIKFIFPNYNYYKNNNGSEILGFLDFLQFSLPELTTPPTIFCCCIVVSSGCKTASETELGPCPPKLTAESASSGTAEVSVKTDRQFIL